MNSRLANSFLFFLLLIVCSYSMIEYKKTAPHNTDCYTQGIFFLNDTHIFESCGLYEKSYFHVLEYDAREFSFTETFLSAKPFLSNIFLEGSVMFQGYIYIMTWKEHQVFKIDPVTFQTI